MTILNKRGRRWGAVAAALLVSTALAACSTETSSSGGTGGPATSQEKANAEAAQKKLDALYAGTSYHEPPTSGPAAQRGKNVFMVNVGVQAPTGSAVAEAARQAAAILGWHLTIFDGKFQPNLYQEGIRQAIASHADVIWNFAIDCPVARTAFQEAKQAGIPVVSEEAADCSDVDPSAPSLFTENLTYSEGSFIDWSKALGAAQADWIIAQTEGKAKVIEIAVPDLITTKALHEGFVAEMQTCDTCQIVQTVQTSAAVLGPDLQTKVEQTLLRNPSANAVEFSYDDLLTGGGAAAIRSSGRSKDLVVVGGTGFKANNDLIREGQGQDAGYGIDYTYEAWAAADLLNRYLAGQPAVDGGVGIQVYDRDHGLPADTFAAPITDFKSRYTAMWQAGS
ncbi:sugar ABC transporter substrate-binding protein [Nocardioides ultimimeridianus]